MKQIKTLMQREKSRHRSFNDIEGETFGRLRVISYAGYIESRGDASNYWNCACECGVERAIRHDGLLNGTALSCGCMKGVKISAAKLKHGHARKDSGHSNEYKSWMSMKEKCLNPKCASYKNYGGCGIYICDHWLYSFENFLSDMGQRPYGKVLGRKDTSGNYEPGNCLWMTQSEASSKSADSRRGKKQNVSQEVRDARREWAKAMRARRQANRKAIAA